MVASGEIDLTGAEDEDGQPITDPAERVASALLAVPNAVSHLYGYWREDHLPNLQRVKVGRNELCPCDSGKKFKRCCLE